MRGCLTLLLALILFVIAPLSLLAFNAQRALLSPDTYRPILREEVLRPAFMESVVLGMGEDVPEEALQPQELASLVEDLIPRGWIDRQVNTNFRAFLEWLNSDRLAPDIRIDLRPVKENAAEAVAHLAQSMWESIPTCAEGELPQVTEDLPSCRTPEMSLEQFTRTPWEELPLCAAGGWPPAAPSAYPSCRPEGMAPEEYLSAWWSALPECGPEVESPPGWSAEAPPDCRYGELSLGEILALVDPLSGEGLAYAMPDEITLADLGDDESSLEGLYALRDSVRGVRLGSYAGLGLSAMLLTLIALLSALSARAFLGRVGGVLLVVGLLTLGIAGVLVSLTALFSSMVNGVVSQVPGPLAALARDLVGRLVGAIATPLFIESLLLAGVGTAMLVTRFILGRSSPKSVV